MRCGNCELATKVLSIGVDPPHSPETVDVVSSVITHFVLQLPHTFENNLPMFIGLMQLIQRLSFFKLQ